MISAAIAVVVLLQSSPTQAPSWVTQFANQPKAKVEAMIGKGTDVKIGYYDRFGSQVRSVSELAALYTVSGLKKVAVGYSFLPDVQSDEQLANIINIEFSKRVTWQAAFKALSLETKGVVVFDRPTNSEVSADCSLKKIPGLPTGWYGQFMASKSITVLNLVHGQFVSDQAMEWLKK